MNRLIAFALTLIAGMLVPLGAHAGSAAKWVTVVKETFAAGAGHWERLGGRWSVEQGRYAVHHPDPNSNAIALPHRAPILDTQTIEATVRVRQRLATEGWSLAGIILFLDPGSLWALTLTEDAQGERYVDFVESHRGLWQAQNADGPTRLRAVGQPRLRGPWEPGRDYRLRLELRRDGIAATVRDAVTGSVVAQARYAFGTAEVVRMGMAGLLARGSAAEFDNLTVTAPAPRTTAPAGLKVESGPQGSIAILRDALPGFDQAAVTHLAGKLRQAGFGVTFLSAAEAADPAILTPERFFLYVVPNAAVYPAHGARTLMTYLRQRGHLVLLGGPPFTRPVWNHQGEWIDRDIMRARLAKLPAERLFLDFQAGQSLAAWERATNDPDQPAALAVEAGGPDGKGHCLRLFTGNLTGWNTYASPVMPGMFAPGQNLLCFWAKGDERTTQLSVEMKEKDGSRWIAVVPLKPEWTYYVLAPEEFAYWSDSETKDKRGGAGDRFQPRNAERIVLGLAFSHTTAVGEGPHTLWVARLGTAANPFPGFAPSPQDAFLPIESVTPAYKVYPLPAVETVAAAPGQAVLAADTRLPVPREAFSCIPRPGGQGFGNERKWRWIPLLEATDREGRRRGHPAWLLLNQAFPFAGSAVAVFGIGDPALYRSAPLANAVVSTVRRLRQGVFLSEGGARHFSWWPGEKVELGATASNLGARRTTVLLRLQVETKEGGRPLFREEVRLGLAPGDTRSLTRAWDPAGITDECRVTVELVRSGKVIDRIRHDFGFLPSGKPDPDEFITVRGSDFIVKGQRWYGIGVNYWPLYVSGFEPEDFTRPWLDPKYYDPDEVERDLERLKALGMNMVSIQMGDLAGARNLADFLRRCRKHGIWVNGFIGTASPIAFDEAATAALIRAARLDENPALWAYDTIWEPGNWMFSSPGRDRWDPDWEAWILERYGSLAAAEADWGMPVPRKEGKVTSPSDHQLSQDGEWRVLVAAYRRFMDDLMSRKWNDATRALRRLDPNHLISFRQGNTLPHDFAFTATVKHIDFVCPEGYSIPPGERGYHAAGFINRYVHFTTGGKPIFWSEFGSSVWDSNRMCPSEALIAQQAEYHDLFYRVMLDAGANAVASWWWVGGYRTNERSDYGILNPDGTPRPAAQLLARYAPRLKSPRDYPAPEVWLTIDRDAHAGGYWYLAFNDGAEAYRRARAEGKNLGIRTAGTGTDSCTTPLVAVGNRPYTGQNPPKYLNAEFNWLQIRTRDGQWVEAQDGAAIPVAAGAPVRARVSVGNTMEARWLTPASAAGRPGAVFLASAEGSVLSVRLPIPADTPYLGDADFGEITLPPAPAGETRVVLQMTAEGRAWFGEKRDFTLVAE